MPTGLTAAESSYACGFADLRWTQSTNATRGPPSFHSHGSHTVTVRAVDSSGNASAHGAPASYPVSPNCPLENG